MLVACPNTPRSDLKGIRTRPSYTVGMRLSERDRDLAETLAYRVRFFSTRQLIRHWWKTKIAEKDKVERSATRRLHQLCKASILERRWVSVEPELNLGEPVFQWSPGEPEPNFGSLAWSVQSRWKGVPEQTEIYQIGRAGLSEFGGRAGGPKRLAHIRHDLHMGTVYLALLGQDESVKKRWISEDELAPERIDQKLPDAMLRQNTANSAMVIEFGGAYDSEHIRSFHQDCGHRDLPYQLW